MEKGNLYTSWLDELLTWLIRGDESDRVRFKDNADNADPFEIPPRPPVSLGDINKGMQKDLPELSSDFYFNLLILIRRLINDGYVDNRLTGSYGVSLSGKEHMADGGYQGKKKKADEHEALQRELLEYQKKNAAWQKRWGNKLAVSSVVTAFLSLVTTSLIAIYLKGKPAPVENYNTVRIDSSFNPKAQQSHIEIPKTDSPKH